MEERALRIAAVFKFIDTLTPIELEVLEAELKTIAPDSQSFLSLIESAKIAE